VVLPLTTLVAVVEVVITLLVKLEGKAVEVLADTVLVVTEQLQMRPQTLEAVVAVEEMELQVVQEVVALLLFVLQILLRQQVLVIQKLPLAQIKFGHLQATEQ
tara:strand:+ start:248 stop:556 length:309 start_codon:yes stop_codon:yes gene_type:complete